MKTLTMSNKEFENLKSLPTLPGVFFAESAALKLLNYQGKIYLLKKLNIDINNGDIKELNNKMYTIKLLDTYRQYIPDSFLLPEFLVAIDKNINTFAMNYINGINLSEILNDPLLDCEDKKYYLKRVGQILEQMKSIREKTPLTDFYLGDLHEDNFIISREQRKIYVGDLDSSKIMDNDIPNAKYLTPSPLLNYVPDKYPTSLETVAFTNYQINENTDIYCYVIIPLNYLYNGHINNLEIKEYYRFINYLDDIKVNQELLNCFDKILSRESNINPVNYIDSLTSKQICLARKKYSKK